MWEGRRYQIHDILNCSMPGWFHLRSTTHGVMILIKSGQLRMLTEINNFEIYSPGWCIKRGQMIGVIISIYVMCRADQLCMALVW